MVRFRGLLIAAVVVFCLSLASCQCGAIFLGTGISLDKHLGDTINFNLGKTVGVGNSAYGLAGMNVGVTWGVDYDLAAMAGYPYGYGGVGSVTQGDMGYNLGVTIDAVQGAGFNGADWGVPSAQQALQTTHYGKQIAEHANINDVNVLMPWA